MWVLQGTPISVLPRTVAPTPQSETFTQYVNTLHPWELELLRHTSFAANQTSICETLSHGFRVVSDGSVKDKHGNGSFGWVMSSASGQRLVYGMEPARGRALHSYRAEACGLMSVLRFLIRYRKFTHSHADWPGILATDAQSVLDTLRGKDRDPQAVDTPVDLDAGKVVLDVLCPEWDVLIEIQAATKLIPHLRIHYVKGHQDQDKAYEKLNLMGQLNVDADEQARKHGNEHGECRPFALLSPLTRAHLLLPDGTVTGKFATVLQHEATAKPLQEYIRKKNEWTPFIMQSINWDAHRLALNRSSTRRTHMIKMLHEILPTNGLANKFDKGQRTCPLCPDLKEDRDHILTCQHPTRQQWRQVFLIDLNTFLETTNTSPLLQMLLLDSLKQWFESDNEVQIDPNDHEDTVCTIIRQQNSIGWRQIIHGRFGTGWAERQEEHYRQRFPNRNKKILTGIHWQTSVILFVWDKWYTLWKERNQEQHGRDHHARAEADQRESRRRLATIYAQRASYEPNVQALLV
jgi:hypothetical protein